MAKKFTADDFSDETLNEYSDNYSEDGLWSKVTDNAASIGKNLIYKAFQLYYVTENPSCPMKVKAGILGALGLLISPLDFLPDFMPVVGYTDDAAAIGAAILLAQMYIDDDVKFKSKKKMEDLLGKKFISGLD